MINEETLYQLIQASDPESILVAQDLAMELDCGLPVVHMSLLVDFKLDVDRKWGLSRALTGRFEQAYVQNRCSGVKGRRKSIRDDKYWWNETECNPPFPSKVYRDW